MDLTPAQLYTFSKELNKALGQKLYKAHREQLAVLLASSPEQLKAHWRILKREENLPALSPALSKDRLRLIKGFIILIQDLVCENARVRSLTRLGLSLAILASSNHTNVVSAARRLRQLEVKYLFALQSETSQGDLAPRTLRLDNLPLSGCDQISWQAFCQAIRYASLLKLSVCGARLGLTRADQAARLRELQEAIRSNPSIQFVDGMSVSVDQPLPKKSGESSHEGRNAGLQLFDQGRNGNGKRALNDQENEVINVLGNLAKDRKRARFA